MRFIQEMFAKNKDVTRDGETNIKVLVNNY